MLYYKTSLYRDFPFNFTQNNTVNFKLLRKQHPILTRISRFNTKYEIIRNSKVDVVHSAYGLKH